MAISLDPATGLSEFFDFIWGSEVGFVYLPTREGIGKDARWSKTFYHWPRDKAHVVDHVMVNSQKKDVYFSPMVWDKPILNRSHIKGTHVLYADFDGNAPTDWSSEPGEANTAAVPGHPSAIVQSSTETHQHVYWKLNEFQSDLTYVENTNRAIAYSYSADTSGWDVEQVLRPPFSTNYKHGLQVMLSSFDTTEYSANQFASFKPVKQLIQDNVDTNNLPDALELIGEYVWDTDNLDLLTKAVPAGSRSSALMRIGYKCAELGMSATEIYAIVLHLDDRLGKFVNRNDRAKRLLDVVNRSLLKYPHKLEEPTFAGLTSGEAPVAEDTRYVFGFKDFLQADFKVPWAIVDLMPMNGLGIIVSATNVGKTQVLSQMCFHQALGRNFIGYDFNETRRKGAIFSLEMGPVGYYRLVAVLAQGYSPADIDSLQENCIIIPLGEPMPLGKLDAANAFFEKVIKEHKLEWIAIDSLQKIYTGKLSDDEIRGFFNYLASLRQRYGFYVWLVHHNRKAQGDNKRPNTLDDVYGSMYITAEPDAILALWQPVNSKDLEVIELKNRYAEKAKPFKIRRTEHLMFERIDGPTSYENLEAKDVDLSTPLGVSPSNPPGESREGDSGFFSLL